MQGLFQAEDAIGTEFIDFATGANRTPIGFYQAYPGLSVQDIHALIADSKSQSGLNQSSAPAA
jgi:hypothetical protein